MSEQTKPVLVERQGFVVTVVLNCPDKLNALNLGAWTRLGEVFATLNVDAEVRCVVLRGAGGKAFAAGADISEFESKRSNAEQAKRYGESVDDTMKTIAESPHPTIALIEGACVGGGLEIASVCDLRICGASSRFGVPINKLGLTMAYNELRSLLALVGPAAAKEILLEGKLFGAERALELGLVNRVVPDGDIEAETYAAARHIAGRAPLVNRWHKKFIRRLADPTPLTPEELDEGYAAFDTQDFQRGYRAFLDKEDPEFEGD